MREPILWYFADPMCSWCWGFSPVITQIKETFADKIKISLNLGGLRPGTTETITTALREEILHHWRDVQQLTGQPFLFDDAMPDGFIYDTEPASRAVLSFGKLQPHNTLAYFSAIQSAFYTQGRDVTQMKVLTVLAEQFSVEPQAFQTLFDSDEYRTLTLEHFKRSRQAGVQGFPTLIWQEGKQTETLCRGYRSWEDMQAMIEHRLEKTDTQ